MIHGSQFWEEEIFSSKGSYKLSAESFKLHESAFLWESDCLSKSVPKKKKKETLISKPKPDILNQRLPMYGCSRSTVVSSSSS